MWLSRRDKLRYGAVWERHRERRAAWMKKEAEQAKCESGRASEGPLNRGRGEMCTPLLRTPPPKLYTPLAEVAHAVPYCLFGVN